jgi:CheY-like chemotaxis protein
MPQEIMIIDDEADTVDMVTNLLKSEGYHITSAPNGKKALEILRKRKDKPDLLLVDMFMPEMSGRELCKIIRKEPDLSLRDIKIAFFTVASFREDGRKLLRDLNILDYIVKPFDLQDFLQRIRKMLKD